MIVQLWYILIVLLTSSEQYHIPWLVYTFTGMFFLELDTYFYTNVL